MPVTILVPGVNARVYVADLLDGDASIDVVHNLGVVPIVTVSPASPAYFTAGYFASALDASKVTISKVVGPGPGTGGQALVTVIVPGSPKVG